ncbi:hypothetical protein [Specibacter cremeus]|nr:hypothetical protein [Specibacter cremeus]
MALFLLGGLVSAAPTLAEDATEPDDDGVARPGADPSAPAALPKAPASR